MDLTNTTFIGLINLINAETGGFFPIVILLTLFSVSFIYLSRNLKASISAFFSLSFLLPFIVFFLIIGWFSGEQLLLYLLLLGVAGVFAYLL
jgi:hypothetical protein